MNSTGLTRRDVLKSAGVLSLATIGLSRRDWPKSAGTIGRYQLRIERFLSVALAALLLMESARAQEVRPYPDPGYRRLGVYAGGPDS